MHNQSTDRIRVRAKWRTAEMRAESLASPARIPRLIFIFIVVIDRLPNCLGQSPIASQEKGSPLVQTNGTTSNQSLNTEPRRRHAPDSWGAHQPFPCRDLKRKRLARLNESARRYGLQPEASNISSILAPPELEAEVEQADESLQMVARNSSLNHHLEAAQTAQLVVDPIAPPIGADPGPMHTFTTNATASPASRSSSLNAYSRQVSQGDKRETWMPIRRQAPEASATILQRQAAGRTAPRPGSGGAAPPMAPLSGVLDASWARKLTNSSLLTSTNGGWPAREVPARQRRFSFLNSRASQQADPPLKSLMQLESNQMRDWQESASTSNVQLALLQQLLASQQLGGRQRFPKGPVEALPLLSNRFSAHLEALMPAHEPQLRHQPAAPIHTRSDGLNHILSHHANANPLAATSMLLQPGSDMGQQAQKPDIGEDGSSMVTYSLVPQSQMNEQSQQAISPLAQPAAAELSTGAEQNGLSQEQLMSAIAQFGQQPLITAAEPSFNQLQQQQQQQQQPQLQQQQQQQQPALPSNFDSALISLFENMIKTNLNQALPGATINSDQQQDPQQRQQQQAIAHFTGSASKLPAATIQNRTTLTTAPVEAQQVGELRFPQAHANDQAHQHHPHLQPHQAQTGEYHQHPLATINPQDSQLEPIYSTNPKRRQKKKRKRTDRPDGGKSPIVRYATKKPRAGAQQQFYEHNSPTDLQPSATFHKWKYPWLYRPPDDDEDEEEGETEINLRFFNNFSRMGPFQGLARTAAPATFIISFIFLILSNVSLAFTIIVHGISSFLRSISQHQQPVVGSSSPTKITGRLARLLSYEPPTRVPSIINRKNVSSTIPQPSKRANDTATVASSQEATKSDQIINSFSKAWEAEF